jgi:outer membrane protein assembly factor BamB
MNQFSKVAGVAFSLFLCLALMSCGGSSKPPAPAADFSLAATPGTISIVAGGAAQQISVVANPANGFTAMVSVAITGLPAGVTASPATLTLAPGTAQSIKITAAASTVAASATLTLTGISGTLTHATSVAATIAPPPDFTLSVAPASLSITSGAAGIPVSVTATAVNAFTGTVAVAITGLPAGVIANPSTLSLSAGTAQSTTLTAAAGSVPSVSTITFTGTSGTLAHSATLALTVLANAPDITTYHSDISRDGLNAKETMLTLANVNSTQFGRVGFDTVDGKVDAQPLFLANVIIAAQPHNVVYIASEHGSLYAFDADSGTQLWKTSILGTGETPSDDHACSQITPEIGITATPVIDRAHGANGTIFVVGTSKDAAGAYHHRLHALDITTGAEITGSPSEVAASVPGTGDGTQNGNVVFDPAQYAERSALLLLNGNIYTSWTSHCDFRPYTGWEMAYSEATLKQTQLINLTPNGNEGAIWMTGNGPAADSEGNIYLLDANGTFDTTFDANGFPAQGDYGNAMVKLSTAGKLAVTDYFETFNTNVESAGDIDLGSGGEILLPDQTDAAGGVHHLIVGAGKDKNIYIADRDNLGKYNPVSNPADSNIYQVVMGQLANLVYSTPAYFNGFIYYGAVLDTLKAFPMTNAKLANAPTSQSTTAFAYPGTNPEVSANGNEQGIVWALESATANPAVLHAYDATNLGHELYNSNQAPAGRDAFGNGNKFIAPLIVNGKVYVGTQTGVAVFGLLPQ